MSLSLHNQRVVNELVELITLMAERGGYILVGTPDTEIQRQVKAIITQEIPATHRLQEFSLSPTSNLLDSLLKQAHNLISIENLDALITAADAQNNASTVPDTQDLTDSIDLTAPRSLLAERSRSQLSQPAYPSTPLGIGLPTDILTFLKLYREVFHENQILALFWVQTETLNRLMLEATDFWDGRVGCFEFIPEIDVLQRTPEEEEAFQAGQCEVCRVAHVSNRAVENEQSLANS